MSSFTLPQFRPPDFTGPSLNNAPVVLFKEVESSGVAPEGYHATSIYPEYFQVRKGEWVLPKHSRMDCAAVLEADGTLEVRESRLLEPGDRVACGRGENGEDGIFVHVEAFGWKHPDSEKFAFRTRISRETSFSYDYDELYNLLEYDRDNGFLLWVLGPAVAFDKDSRDCLAAIIDEGFVHGVLAGNALATHDIEAALFGTALGQDIYTKRHARLGHYRHLDAINRRDHDSTSFIAAGGLKKWIQPLLLLALGESSAAIFDMLRVEVFVAMTALDDARSDTVLTIPLFISRFSTVASRTKSAPATV